MTHHSDLEPAMPTPPPIADNTARARPTPGADAGARYRVAERVLDRSASIARRAFAALVAIAEQGRRRPGRGRAASPPAPAAPNVTSSGLAELGVGAPPSAAGFAAVHLGADASEAAGMRKLADAEAAMPAFAAALAEVPLSRHVHQQLALKATPETADAWALRIRTLDHVTLRRLVECAEVGQSPDTIDVRVGAITDGPLPPAIAAAPAEPAASGAVTQDPADASEAAPTQDSVVGGIPAAAATQDSGAGETALRVAQVSVGHAPDVAPAGIHGAGGGVEAPPPGLDVATESAGVDSGPWTLDSGLRAGEGARWRFAASAAFDALDYEAFERAWKHVGAADHVTYRPVEAIAAMVRRLRARSLARRGVRPDDVADWQATRPFRLWLVDRATRRVWLETGRGELAVPPEALPVAPADGRWRCRRDVALVDGPDGRAVLAIRVQAERGAWVPLTPTALAEAAPELRETPGGRRPHRRTVRHLPRDGALLPPVGGAAAPLDTEFPAPKGRSASDLLDYCVGIGGPPLDATAAELRALAPSGTRVHAIATHAACHALTDAADAGRVRIRTDAAAGPSPVTVDGVAARLSAGDARDRLRVGRALRSLPWIDAAFAAGVVPYSKVRALVRVATPATDARWAPVARRTPVEGVEALVAAAKPGADPPRVPPGRSPLWPVGRPQRLALYGKIEGEDAAALAAWRARLDALAGRPLETGEALGALAGIYLRTFDRRRRRDLVIYTLAPESRAAEDRAGLVAPEIRAAGPDPADRLRAMFPLLVPVWDRMARRDRRGGAAPRDGKRPGKGIRPTASMRDAMHARDGVRCPTPFCPHGLVIHWGHLGHACEGDPADLATDYPPCGPCNNAVEAGELRITRDPEGRLVVSDGAGNPITPRRRLGVHLDRTLLARLWTHACRDLGVDEGACPMPFLAPARSARRPVGSAAGADGARAPLWGGALNAPAPSRGGVLAVDGIREADPVTQDPRARGRPPTYGAAG